MVWFLNLAISVSRGLYFSFKELSNQRRTGEIHFEQT